MKISRNRFQQTCASLTALAATAAVVVLGAGPFAASASAEPAPTVPPGVVMTLNPVYVPPALPHLPAPTVTTTTVPPAVAIVDDDGDAPAGGDDEGCDGCLHLDDETPDPAAPLAGVIDDTTNPVNTHRNAGAQGSPGCGNDPASALYQHCPEETTTSTVPNSTTSTTVPRSTTASTVPSVKVEDKTAEKAGVLAFTGSSSTLLFVGIGVLLAGAAALVVAKLLRSRRVA